MDETLQIGSQEITLRFNRKPTRFGPVSVDHWWLPIPSLYGQRQQRNSSSTNRDAILAGFWRLVQDAKAHTETDVRESYLLARLVPQVRNQGSRRVFADAFSRVGHADKKRERGDLDELIRTSTMQGIDEAGFHDLSRSILGPIELEPNVRARKEELALELLALPIEMLLTNPEAAFAQVETTWSQLMRSIGRRSRDKTAKLILDVISYEARAALHRAYSAVWWELIPVLQKKFSFSEATARFLTFWHTAPCREQTDPNAYFHVFHGHAFGLHPAGSAFITTAAGRELIGDWLTACDHSPDGRAGGDLIETGEPTRIDLTAVQRAEQAYCRLLDGLLIAIYEYERRLSDVAERRRQRRTEPLPE